MAMTEIAYYTGSVDGLTQITRGHALYDYVAARLREIHELVLPDGFIRVPDGRVWYTGDDLIFEVWQLNADGDDIIIDEDLKEALLEPVKWIIPAA